MSSCVNDSRQSRAAPGRGAGAGDVEKIANQLTELMVGVVTGGTGFAGAIAEAQVAGKTGTAELGPKPEVVTQE